LGIGFDGDADRIGAVDAKGRLLAGDQLLAILAADVLADQPGATIIADVKASIAVFDEIKRLGGNPFMWKAGHSHIKNKMSEMGALLAGEMSGHIFFAHKYYGFDDALYSAVRVLSLLASGEKSLAELRDALPIMHSTPEYRVPVEESRKFAIVDEIKARALSMADAEVSDVDGVRVSNASGWWLVRTSNTQAMVSARVESYTEAGLAQLMDTLRSELAASGVQLTEKAGH
jgi:phosphomannomutase